MAEDFSRAVETGLHLAKRIYFGNDRTVTPPKTPPLMVKSSFAFLPTAPMVYAVIHDPVIVDNPDIPSYQPHVHGRCDPPALIPIQMNAIDLSADCYLDTAVVTVSGTWRLHCVTGSRSCDCRIAVPIGAQGSILGVEVSVNNRKFYSTHLVDLEGDNESWIRAHDGGFLKANVFTMNIAQIDGGSLMSVKVTWSQKILCCNNLFSLEVPFNFPDFVNPAGKRMAKREKIYINVNAVTGNEFLSKTISHPLKEMKHGAGNTGFLYDSDVLSFSKTDFSFSYSVPSSQINCGVLLQSPSVDDFDHRELFCMYLSPGNIQSSKVFKKDIIFVIDISASMRGSIIEDTKNALSVALSKLDPDDSFSIIAFNGESYLFSTLVESASKDTVERAIDWINMNFVAGGDTNISHPLNTAIEMLSGARNTVPIIFLATDGAVENEREICDMVKRHMINEESISLRLYTFGIGSFCNHYFLRMLAMLGRGQYDAAQDVDLVEPHMLRLFDKASSLVLANITMDIFNDLDEVEVYPSHIPDLSTEGPLILSGRYKGSFPENLQVKGVLADFSNFVSEVKIQKDKDIPIQRVSARDQIDCLTAQAWLSENKQLEQKIAKLSLQTGFLSEYTGMTVLEKDLLKKVNDSEGKKEAPEKMKSRKKANIKGQGMILLPYTSLGFGDLTATAENTLPGSEEPRLPDGAEVFVKAASNCCSSFCNHCCCMCCIVCCSKMNHQCANTLTQLCVGLGCYGCLSCCADMCFGSEG